MTGWMMSTTPPRLTPRGRLRGRSLIPVHRVACVGRGGSGACTSPRTVGRRAHLSLGLGLGLGSIPFANAATGLSQQGPQASAPTVPFIEVALDRLRLPSGGYGADYVLLPLRIGDTFSGSFLLDSGLTANLITPETQKKLGTLPDGGFKEGMTAGGSAEGRVVTLERVALANQRLRPLHALVIDFPQHKLPGGEKVAGMLGVEFLLQVDVDLDYDVGRARFYKPGKGKEVAERLGMREIALQRLPAELLGVPMEIHPKGQEQRQGGGEGEGEGSNVPPQEIGYRPLLGIFDTGSSFSAVNVEAAVEAGLLPSDEAERVAALDSMRRAGVVYALGIEGKLTELPLLEADEDLVAGRSDILGEGGLGGGQGVRVHVDGSKVAVGDLAVFGELFGREEGRNRALGLVGMDVWGRQRVIISARNGALFV